MREWRKTNCEKMRQACIKCNFAKRIGKYCPHELARKIDMNGNSIPEEFYPPVPNLMPPTKGLEREAWLASPEGLLYVQKQSVSHLGKMTGSEHPNFKGGPVDVVCAECGVAVPRKQCEITKIRNKDGEARFFCNQKCNGVWKKKNLVGDKVYNHTLDLEFTCGYSGCGKIVFRKQHQLRPGQTNVFCDQTCADKAKIGKSAWNKGATVEVPCAACDNLLTKLQSEVERSKNGRFYCNQKCVGAWKSKNFTFNDEHRQKLKDAAAKRLSEPGYVHHSKGTVRPHSEATKEKMRLKALGRTVSEETKAKISNTKKLQST